MIFADVVRTPIWPVVCAWMRHLADRFEAMQEQVRHGVIEAISRTAAEATEVALHSIFNIARYERRMSPELSNDEFAGEPFQEHKSMSLPKPNAEHQCSKWSLRTTARATLHGVRWWLRQRTTHPLTTTAMTMVSAALILLD